MRLYAGTSKNFIEDTLRNQVTEKLRKAFFDYYRHNPSDSEVHFWNNSLVRIKDVLQQSNLTDHGILLEYQPCSAAVLVKRKPRRLSRSIK